MRIVLRYFIVWGLVSLSVTLCAQDTLPSFSVVNRNGKIILSWVNDFPVIKQLSIQRSADSTKGFKTILTLPDPSSVTNGFLDNNAPNDSSFYKLYILLDGGNYIFSKVQKPHLYHPPVAKKEISRPQQQGVNEKSESLAGTAKAFGNLPNEKTNSQNANTSPPKSYQVQPASGISDKNRSDGLKAGSVNAVRPETFTPSAFVFTNKDGNITIVVPPEKFDHFKIKFFEEGGYPLFQIDTIKEHVFTIDKSNFFHSGWFSFELFEDGILREKSKVRIP